MYFAPAAGGIAIRLRPPDVRHHCVTCLGIGAVHLRSVALHEALPPVVRRDVHLRDCVQHAAYETEALDACFAQQTRCQRAARDACGGFPCACALQHITAVIRQPLDRAGEVRMSGTRSMHRRRALRIIKPAVAVDHLHDDRTAGRPAAPHSGGKRDRIRLNPLPSAAPVSPLPAAQFVVDKPLINGKAGGHPFNKSRQRRSVRFARSSKGKPRHGSPIVPDLPGFFTTRIDESPKHLAVREHLRDLVIAACAHTAHRTARASAGYRRPARHPTVERVRERGRAT